VSNVGTKKDEGLAMGVFYYDFVGAPSSFYGRDQKSRVQDAPRRSAARLAGFLRGALPTCRQRAPALARLVDELPKVSYRFGVVSEHDLFSGSRSGPHHEGESRG
jgi:hypothetical protein